MKVKLKFQETWVYFTIIFISLSNGTQTGSRTAIIIKEDPLVDKITKVNHNLKLVKLKKVKKVYTNLPEDDDEKSELSKKPTIINTNTKHNVVTQTPIPFLITDKAASTQGNLNENHVSMPNDLNEIRFNSPVDFSKNSKSNNNFQEINLKNKKLDKSAILNRSSNESIRDDLPSHLNEIDQKNASAYLNDDSNSRKKAGKVLFPSVNKFKNSLNHLSRSTSVPGHESSAKKFSHNTSVKKFATSSTIKNDFTNKVQVTTIKPSILTTKKPMKLILKSDRFKSALMTTEAPRTFTYKSNKRTTTYMPYVYTATVTSAPILRIRKSYPTTLKQQNKSSSKPPTISDTYRTGNGFAPNQNEDTRLDQKSYFVDRKAAVQSSGEEEKPDLESNNSNRKYAKLFFDRDKSKRDDKITIRPKDTTIFRTTTTIPPTTTSVSRITSNYLRTNSRLPTFQTYTPKQYTAKPYTTTVSPENRIEITTKSVESNQIDNGKILIAVRKRPIYRPRTARPSQEVTVTIAPKPIVQPTESSKFQPVTETTSFKSTTYSPRFRSTTVYPARYRSTTELSSNNELKPIEYTTTPAPVMTTNHYYKYKETDLYRQQPGDEYKSSYMKIELTTLRTSLSDETTDLPEQQPTESPKTDLMSNFIPRRSKWILKGTRQRKSETTDNNRQVYTKPIPSYTEQSTDKSSPKLYLTTTPLSILLDEYQTDKSLADYKTSDRTIKSIEPLYQLKPKSFLISEMATKNPDDLSILNFKYEDPRREKSSNSIDHTSEPEKEVHYQDIKVRKESKLVPQTYLYPTSTPVTLDNLNERLSYLNDQKLKYQMPYESKYPTTENNEPISHYDSYEKRPKYPSNLAYIPINKLKYQSSPFDHKNRPSPATNDLKENNPYSYHQSGLRTMTTTDQPYIRSHFNLGPSLVDIPKYGPQVDKQQLNNKQEYKSTGIISNSPPQIKPNYQPHHNTPVSLSPYDARQIVGKLSKAFTNQAPIPYFAPENSKHDSSEKEIYDRYPEIDLKRIPIKNQENRITVPYHKNPIREHSGERLNEIRDKNHQDVEPFNFSKYKPLPNTKFIRTDLENNEIPDQNYRNEPRPVLPVKESKYIHPTNYHQNIQDSRTESDRQNYPLPVYSSSLNARPQTNSKPTSNHQTTGYNSNEISNPIQPGRGFRFKFNRIPAKVIYDKYNQKFVGTINLNPAKFASRPLPKHYADIPEHVRPIEYQKPTISPPVDTTKKLNLNSIPISTDYQRYKNSNSAYNLPEYQPVDRKPDYRWPQYKPNVHKSEYEPVNKVEYRPPYSEYRPIMHKPVHNDLIRDQYSSHPTERDKENSISNYPVDYNKKKIFSNNDSPVRFYSDSPKYHSPFNSQPYKVENNRSPNNLMNNNNNQFRSQFDTGYTPYREQSHPTLPRSPKFRPQENTYQNYPINSRNQFKPMHNNHQFNDAGHYDVDDRNARTTQSKRPYTNDIEMINLNDIEPSLSLFNDKMPDFKLLQHSVISHDIPVANTYNL